MRYPRTIWDGERLEIPDDAVAPDYGRRTEEKGLIGLGTVANAMVGKTVWPASCAGRLVM